MIENIVSRAKKMAIKEFLETGQKGMRVAHLLAACVDEFSENEDLPNTTNPDDWARISGKKGERIVYIRTLVSGNNRQRRSAFQRVGGGARDVGRARPRKSGAAAYSQTSAALRCEVEYCLISEEIRGY
jgi:hypothetical protein